MSSRSKVTDQGSSTTGHGTVRRRGAVLALVIAVVFVVFVLVGAKILVDRSVYTPVAMGPVDAPAADSDTCAAVIDDLPGRLGDYRDVGVADPAPEGTAGYRDSGGTELSLRCGVSVPAQYTELSSVEDSGGEQWLQVADATPGSDLTTWYSVGHSPVVAVTTEGRLTSGDLAGLGEVTTRHGDGDDAPAPAPAPLADLRTRDSGSCGALEDALPDTLGEYRRLDPGTLAPEAAESVEGALVWVAEGREPVVLRCGVDLPDSYEAGAQLTQVDDVPWFQDTALAEGSTAGVWYSMGYADTVAVSLPLDAGNSVLTAVSEAVDGNLERTAEQ
ncbi:DUF3515 domain-containing protein [Corynebacterium sp.]|uniref:DUF3515 domain-containing protein n=1 Tax=Corynebacterium sp. TaxID=1720 RepID=UPI0025B97F28|nr:DUF3515 domain-containing protein [Corynebacterium sp.]